MKIFLCLISFFLLFSKCTPTKSDDHSDSFDSTSNTAHSDTISEEIKVYSLPAPLQIPYEIKKNNPRYYEDLLKPSDSNPENISNNFKKALNLGVYAVDLGYTTTYNQGQSAINYLTACIKLSEQLNINTAITSNIIDRYKKNLSNRDSLNNLIIRTFSEINRNLTESKRQADAALILTGSFIEGVHLSAGIYERNKTPIMVNIIGHQKLFLDNLLEILQSYKSDDMIKLVSGLLELKSAYDQVEIRYLQSEENGERIIENITASDKTISLISKKVKEIREEIIS